MANIKTNQVILGKYKIVEFINAGGMGVVYKVYDLEKNVFLAMKVLDVESEFDSASEFLFNREANAYKNLSHPNIVPYYGKDQYEDSLFLLMGFIDGDSLKTILTKFKNQPFPLIDTLVIMKALSAALGYAHFKDVVHCDIKPGNVLLDKTGNIFLTDFGIARHADSDATKIAGAGTTQYMAPEQIREETVSKETDIYALGVVLFEMLTGQKLFRSDSKSTEQSGKSNKEIIQDAHLHEQPPDPREINPQINESLSRVILKALAKKASDRYQSTHEMMLAICEACEIPFEEIPDRINPYLIGLSEPPIIADPKPDPGSEPIPPRPIPKKITQYSFFSIIFIIIAALFIFRDSIFPNPDVSSISTNDQIQSTMESPTLSSLLPTKTKTKSPTPPKVIEVTKMPTSTPISGDTRISIIDQVIMVFVPAGDFLMGSSNNDPYYTVEKFKDEQPQHKVSVDSFWIGQTEVTNQMFSKFINETGYMTTAEQTGKGFTTQMDREASLEVYGADWHHPYGPSSTITGLAEYPVVQLSWYDANAYCQWAGGRLPTEAEWEKAARGTSGAIYPWGNAELNGKLANSADKTLNSTFWSVTSINDGFKFLAPVNSFSEGKSPYGLLNMSGNAWEWVDDWYDPDYYQQNSTWSNPLGPSKSDKKVLKGGSYVNGAKNVRAARRGSNQPGVPLDLYSFRCVYP